MRKRICTLGAVILLMILLLCCGRPSAVPDTAEQPSPETSGPQVVTAVDPKPAETAEPSGPPAEEPVKESTPVPTEEPTPVPTEEPTPVPPSDPVISLNGGEDIRVTAGLSFSDPGFTAADYQGNDLSDRVEVTGEVIPYLVGEYVLSYSVTDDDGRSTRSERHVAVEPAVLPETVMPPEKTVYLTFDDGPSAYTEQLLNVLDKHGAKATFFVVGSRCGTDLLTRMHDSGHAIGVHCYTHVYRDVYRSEEDFLEGFQKTEEAIYAKTGEYTRLLRFPGGSSNTASSFNRGIMTRLTKIMEDMGYRYFDWTFSAGDAEHGTTKTSYDYYVRIINAMRRQTDYCVVLQHDINLSSVHAVEDVLKWGEENGYTFLALDLTSPVVHTDVNN